MREDPDATVTALREQLLRYRADRHPREHATIQFHLGVALITAGNPAAAIVALRVARELFAARSAPIEEAKATNMLGAALRETGELVEAAGCFASAAEVFADHDQPLERGSALFNLGLVERQTAGAGTAAERFTAALELFEEGGAPGQASAAARELGAALLDVGELADAVAVLERGAELAAGAGDRAALGAAANVLGLARLARDEVDHGVAALHDAVAANPRGLRPAAHAMAKANLALAYERRGDDARARLAARQARSVPEAAAAVVEQADAILGRLPERPAAHDVLDVLEEDEPERWAPTLRDELARWASLDRSAADAETRAWIEARGRWAGDRVDLAEAWLGVLLELPPEKMEALIAAAVSAAARAPDEAAATFRREVSSAMGRFHVPQWMRLRETFNRLDPASAEGWR